MTRVDQGVHGPPVRSPPIADQHDLARRVFDTAHLTGDRRLKRDSTSTESRLQFQADAIAPGYDACLQPQ